jgi:hypothetical protein
LAGVDPAEHPGCVLGQERDLLVGVVPVEDELQSRAIGVVAADVLFQLTRGGAGEVES